MEKLKQLDQLIRLKSTGTPEELSKKLNLSKRHVKNYIETLEDLGAEISYCRFNQTYYYKARYKLNLNVSLEELDDNNCFKTQGGRIIAGQIYNNTYQINLLK